MMKRLLISILLAVSIILAPVSVYAIDTLQPVCTGGGAQAAVCQNRTTSNPLLGPNGILTRVIEIVVMFTTVASVIMIMVGGFKYVISNGDSSNVTSAKNTILYAIIGLVVAVLAQSIVVFVLRKL